MTLPFDLTPGAALFLAAAILVAAFIRGYSGFGFAALVVSAAALVTHPLNLVAVVLFCEFAIILLQWSSIARDIDGRRVMFLMAGALVGVPAGLWAITGAGIETARIAIAIYVLVMCGLMLRGWQMQRQATAGDHLAVGVLSGLANGPGMGGLPVATFFTAQTMKATTFRATMIAYFALLDIYTAPLLWWHGLVTRDTFIVTLAAAPLIVVGAWAGGRHFLRTDPQDFRRFAILLLAGLAGLGLMKTVL
jgi:uncharacterized membrane protein YfcA